MRLDDGKEGPEVNTALLLQGFRVGLDHSTVSECRAELQRGEAKQVLRKAHWGSHRIWRSQPELSRVL